MSIFTLPWAHFLWIFSDFDTLFILSPSIISCTFAINSISSILTQEDENYKTAWSIQPPASVYINNQVQCLYGFNFCFVQAKHNWILPQCRSVLETAFKPSFKAQDKSVCNDVEDILSGSDQRKTVVVWESLDFDCVWCIIIAIEYKHHHHVLTIIHYF